jgi:hypothetical protein
MLISLESIYRGSVKEPSQGFGFLGGVKLANFSDEIVLGLTWGFLPSLSFEKGL